jgi:hypothetical protein
VREGHGLEIEGPRVLAEGRFRGLPGKKVVDFLPKVGWSIQGKALTVRVGWPVDSAATYWLCGPADVGRLLSALAEEVGDRGQG